MANVKISELGSGTANANAVVPATNASGTVTEKILMSEIAGVGDPKAHKASHSTGGTDALSPSDIGAAASSHTHTASAITGTPVPVVVNATFASTYTTDATAGDIFDLTLTGNLTLAAPSNTSSAIDGKTLRWRLTQDGTGSRTITLNSVFVIPSSATSPLPFSTAANKLDILAATYDHDRGKWDIISMVPGY